MMMIIVIIITILGPAPSTSSLITLKSSACPRCTGGLETIQSKRSFRCSRACQQSETSTRLAPGTWDHTNPPHPHHPLFSKSKLGCIKCNNLLNTHNTELVHCNSDLSN